MKLDRVTLIFAVTVVFAAITTAEEGSMLYALNGMHRLMEYEGFFDEQLYAEVTACFAQFDDGLMAAQDAEWAGMMEYAATGGADGDTYYDCETPHSNDSGYVEYNCTLQEQGAMPIFEPCDYASNIAYYGTLVEVCKREEWTMSQDYVLAFIRSYAYLAQGSAFLHGSQTEAGHIADIRLNDLFTYIGYQAAVAGLEPLDSSIIHDLSATPRSKSAVETTAELQAIYTERPVTEWTDALNEMDVPGIRLGMCAYIVAALAVFLDSEQLQHAAEVAVGIIGGEDLNSDYEFCLYTALPELDAATQDIELDPETYDRLAKGVAGTLIKLIYGVLWQETLVAEDSFLFSEAGNVLGAALLPVVNEAANALLSESDFPHYDESFQRGEGVYPGDGWCNTSPYPHAKWHLQTGIALADFSHLSNLMNEVFLANLNQNGNSDDLTGGAEAIRHPVGLLMLSVCSTLFYTVTW